MSVVNLVNSEWCIIKLLRTGQSWDMTFDWSHAINFARWQHPAVSFGTRFVISRTACFAITESTWSAATTILNYTALQGSCLAKDDNCGSLSVVSSRHQYAIRKHIRTLKERRTQVSRSSVKGVFIATQLNSTQLNSTDPVEQRTAKLVVFLFMTSRPTN